MSYTEKAPAFYLRDALKAAKDNEPPEFETEVLLQMLHLDDEQRDGRNFLDRLVGDHRLSFPVLRATFSVSHQSRILVQATNERTANPAQEELAQMLGVVVCTQLMREGNACERVNDLALLSTREDIIPLEIRQMISGAPGRPEDLLPPQNLA